MNDIKTDIVIVGGGTAGLAAAVEAAQRGVKTLVIEKSSRTGGCGNMASGLFAVESRYQRQMQMTLTREDVFKYQMEYTHWNVDAHLIKTYIEKSAETIDWLEHMGVEFVSVESHGPGNYYTWHVVKGPTPMGSCATMMKILAEQARKHGATILTNTAVKKIIKSDKGISGVLVEDNSGKELNINVKAVIVATGGFIDNQEMIKKYTGLEPGKDLILNRMFSTSKLTGDGLNLAWEIGAAQSKIIMHKMQLSPMVGRSIFAAFLQPNLVVNLDGKRFINEEVISSNNMYTGNAIALQRNKCAFSIFDEKTKDYYVNVGYDFETTYGVAQRGAMLKATDFDVEIKKAVDNEVDGLYITDSIEELAAKTGINLQGLWQTLQEYNHACDTGRDNLFYRKPRYMRPVREPKFYAIKFFISAFGTLGGIKINYKTEVLDTHDMVIPGLYAAGADAESIYGDTYPITLPGSTMGFAINSGRMAGENASEYVLRFK